MSLERLVELSRRYGAEPEWVLAGGGNTSFKDGRTLYVKASGSQLATIGPEGFARMDRAALQTIWDADYPNDPNEREARALADLMAARAKGEQKRPSVETLMHELFPYAFVVHMHPALINGLSCAQDGERAARKLFGNALLWVPAIEPGYVLARAMRAAALRHEERRGSFPRLVMLQNHGLVVAADTVEEIDRLHKEVRRAIRSAVRREPDLSPQDGNDAARDRWHAAIDLAFEHAVTVEFRTNAELMRRLATEAAFAPLAGAFTPDHIVYAGAAPVFVSGNPINSAAGLRSRIVTYRGEHAGEPRIIAVEGLGAFAVTESLEASDAALSLFMDEVRIAAYAESFGGARHLDPHLVAFIEGWEVERYRKNVSGGGA
ncbi:MAG: class II aldolase/adducin family protein [Spirochaetota bacterium]